MALLEQWRSMAYSETANKGDLQRLWAAYFEKEKEIYAQLLKNPDEVVKGTVKELAEKYDVDIMTMTGFLDGIDESLVEDVYKRQMIYSPIWIRQPDWAYIPSFSGA